MNPKIMDGLRSFLGDNTIVGILFCEEIRKDRVHVHGAYKVKGSRQGLPLPLTL
ncbi:hypothetical protein [Peribacillus simplex]|uniref:hypothetical protein n=1 Tax=Peribacillus simplex TaxID=1478 RepID=UPI00333CA1BC